VYYFYCEIQGHVVFPGFPLQPFLKLELDASLVQTRDNESPQLIILLLITKEDGMVVRLRIPDMYG